MLGRPGQINTIVISNKGDSRTGVDLSEDVTKDLRVLFNDRDVAEELKALFGREDVLGAVDAKVAGLELEVGDSGSSDELDNLRELAAELRKPELTDELSSLLADPEVTQAVVEQMEESELDSAAAEAYTLLSELAEFQVIEIKRDIIDASEEAGTGVTSIFILFSSFSIMVGILLIFLIFVMLASARKSEMGMARAVGAKRRHLVLMFAFEGTAYAIVSAAVGVVLGLGVSMLMVTVMNQIFSGAGGEFHPYHPLRASQCGGGLLPGHGDHLCDGGGVGLQGEPPQHRGSHTGPARVDHTQGRGSVQGAADGAAQVDSASRCTTWLRRSGRCSAAGSGNP